VDAGSGDHEDPLHFDLSGELLVVAERLAVAVLEWSPSGSRRRARPAPMRSGPVVAERLAVVAVADLVVAVLEVVAVVVVLLVIVAVAGVLAVIAARRLTDPGGRFPRSTHPR
jgi:hypothetical protein